MPNRNNQYKDLKLLAYMKSRGGERKTEKSICVTHSQFLTHWDYLQIYQALRKNADQEGNW